MFEIKGIFENWTLTISTLIMLKNIFLLLTFSMIFISCRDDDENIGSVASINPEEIIDTTDIVTPIGFTPLRLTKLTQRINGSIYGQSSQKFAYDDDRIIAVDAEDENKVRYEITYEDQELKEIKAFNIETKELISRDSFSHNEEGMISKIFLFEKHYSGERVSLKNIKYFYYDDSLQLSRMSFYNIFSGKIDGYNQYTWENGNVIQIDHYSHWDQLLHSFAYSYDDKINYKKDIPIFLGDPLNWSANNYIQTYWSDFLGDLLRWCWPCDFEYIYNDQGYPTFTKDIFDRHILLEYE